MCVYADTNGGYMTSVLLEKPESGVYMLRLNRPDARNALSPQLRAELRDHFLSLSINPECHAIVITGDKKSFAAGADIRSMVHATPAEMMARNDEASWAAIRCCPKPIVAAVNGYALGGGCELAMHADIIIAGENATFGQPEVRLGIMPGAGGTQRLVRAIGKYRAMMALLTGSSISAREAFVAGLVSKVVPDEAVVEEAVLVAGRIAAMTPLAVAEIKRTVLAGMEVPLNMALMLEQRAAYLLFGTPEQQAAMEAFIENSSTGAKWPKGQPSKI